jgi:uncharacterized protein YigE (DUF2233 family)
MRNLLLSTVMSLCCLVTGGARLTRPIEADILGFVADPKTQDVRLFWKDDSGRLFGNLERLRAWCGPGRLIFAMNGGMFRQDHSPVGLFIQQGKKISPLDTSAGEGNFYLQPNGVFYLTADRRAGICPAKAFRDRGQVAYATQSGPMLLIDGSFHPAFREGSANVNIRNGVGILPDNRILFALSKQPLNFYAFARFFRDRGCRNALYLDGFVSRAYLPEEGWIQTDGDFGVIIGVTIRQ